MTEMKSNAKHIETPAKPAKHFGPGTLSYKLQKHWNTFGKMAAKPARILGNLRRFRASRSVFFRSKRKYTSHGKSILFYECFTALI